MRINADKWRIYQRKVVARSKWLEPDAPCSGEQRPHASCPLLDLVSLWKITTFPCSAYSLNVPGCFHHSFALCFPSRSRSQK